MLGYQDFIERRVSSDSKWGELEGFLQFLQEMYGVNGPAKTYDCFSVSKSTLFHKTLISFYSNAIFPIAHRISCIN